MRTYLGWLLAAIALPLTAYAQEATVKEVHDTPAVRGSIIANLLQEHDNPFTLYPYDTNYLLYTGPAISTRRPFAPMTGQITHARMR